MRTMLISLIAIYSLALVAMADDPDMVDSGGCGTIYKCFAPASCFVSAERGKPLEQVKVVAIDGPIFNDCPAIIRFYQYNLFRVHVSIESLLDTSEVASIELLQTPFEETLTRTKFSCLNNNGKMEGKLEDIPEEHNDLPVIRIPKNVKDTPSNKLKCSFEVTKKSKAIRGKSNDRITIEITGIQNKKTEINKLNILDDGDVRCDTADFEYDTDDMHDKAKKYSEISYRPGEYFCENENYNIEYRLYGKGEYTKVRTNGIKCDESKFNFDGTPVNTGSTIMIRCAIEVKFLCDYDVKEHPDPEHTDRPRRPVKESPDIAGGKATSLKCPPATPHLMVVENGKEKPIINPEFKCAYYGGDPVWTVNATDQLTKEGPPVYCTNSLPCNVLNPISETNIEMGFLTQTDFLPKCHAEGTMWVGGSEMSGELRCDGMTGKYYYTAGGSENPVDASTKFVCKYTMKKDEAEEENAKLTQDMYEGIGAVVGGIGGVVALIFGVVFVFMFFKVRKERRKKEAENHANFMKYCATNEEKNAAKGGKESTESAPGSEQEWTAATTAMRYDAMATISPEDEGNLPSDFALPPRAKTFKKKPTGKMRIMIPVDVPVADLSRLVPKCAPDSIEKEAGTLVQYQAYIVADNAFRKYAEIDPKKPRNPVIEKKDKKDKKEKKQ